MMSAFDSFPLGQPAFVTHILDRAAHLRSDDEKLFALEKPSRRPRLCRLPRLAGGEAGGRRAARAAEHRRGAEIRRQSRHDLSWACATAPPCSAWASRQAAVEKLIGRDDVAVTELRGMAMQGAVPPDQLSAIAMAKSMVSWHQRHGFCANCGTRTAMKEGGWKRDCPSCKAEHFPRTDPVVIMLVTSRRQMPARPPEAVSARHVFLPCRIRRGRRDHRGRGAPRNLRGIRNPLHRRAATT